MDFVLIPAETFMIRSEDGHEDEQPVHTVRITQPFYLGKYMVTQAQWKKVMGENPSEEKGRRHPVDNVSWHDVQDFIEQLHEKEVGEPYRLPTEAEWEYACRAGTTTPFSFGETITTDQVNYDGHYPYGGGPRGKRRTDAERVGYFQPNAWGLYEMHGNVRDWVADVYHEYYYKQSPVYDPDNVSGFTERYVIRGGWWGSQAKHCTSSNRDRFNPDVLVGALGFRLVRTVNP